MAVETEFSLYDLLDELASATQALISDSVELTAADWNNGLSIQGTDASRPFKVRIGFDPDEQAMRVDCSLCGGQRFCSHLATAADMVARSDIPDLIAENGFVPCNFTLRKKVRKPAKQWIKQFAELQRSVAMHDMLALWQDHLFNDPFSWWTHSWRAVGPLSVRRTWRPDPHCTPQVKALRLQCTDPLT